MKLPKHTGIRTWDLHVHVTLPLDGTLDDWPASVQDTIFAAMERLSQSVELPLTVVFSACVKDHDITDEMVEKGMSPYMLVVILSEIVAADRRYVSASRTKH